jgi:hypothetical protein
MSSGSSISSVEQIYPQEEDGLDFFLTTPAASDEMKGSSMQWDWVARYSLSLQNPNPPAPVSLLATRFAANFCWIMA